MPVSLRLVGCLTVLLSLSSARAADPHRYIPADARMLISVQFRQLLEAPLVDRDRPVKIRDLLKRDPDLLDIIGVKPLEDITTMLVALPTVGEVRKLFVVLQGKFNAPRIHAAIARIHRETFKEHRAGGVTYHQFKEPARTIGRITTPTDVFLAVPDETTCLISVGDQADLERALTDKKGSTPADLRALLEKNDKDNVISFALLPELKGPLAELEPVRKAFGLMVNLRGSIRIDEEVTGRFVTTSATEKAAEQLEDILRGGLNTITGGLALLVRAQRELAPYLEILKTIRVSRDDKQVGARGKLERDVLEGVLKEGEKKP